MPVVFLDECYQNGSVRGNLDHGGRAPSATAYEQGKGLGGEAALGEESVFTDCEKDVNTRLGLLMASQFVVRIVMSFFGSYLCDK